VCFMNKCGISPGVCVVVKPERYRVQPPCVRLCIVDMMCFNYKVVYLLLCIGAAQCLARDESVNALHLVQL